MPCQDFHLSASEWWLEGDNNEILAAKLFTLDQEINESRLSLDTALGNVNGILEWGSADFSKSLAGGITTECTPENPVPVIRCVLKDEEDNDVEAVKNLAERIGNENGELVFA